MNKSPYPGLNPFRLRDAEFFFGRQMERDLIVANLVASRLTLLYGPTGVGKSSVLDAGVLAHLQKDAGMREENTPSAAVIVYRSWQSDPLTGLTNVIRQELGGAPRNRSFREYLKNCSTDMNRDIYIILDQFEEYFLYRASMGAEDVFAAEFPPAVNTADSRVNFLISIREDAVAKLDIFKGRIANLFDNYLRIEHLQREAAAAAIEGPIGHYNQLYRSKESQIKIEVGLTDEILNQIMVGQVAWDVIGRGSPKNISGLTRIEAPYLQLVLKRLWDKETNLGSDVLRSETLKALGGPSEIVRHHLDDVLFGFSEQERTLAAALFHHLVTPSGAKIAHTIADLAAYESLSVAAVERLVRKLAGRRTRILREVAASPGSNESRYEIFHDALAPAVLDWRRQQQEEQLRKGQRIAVSALQYAVESGLRHVRENKAEIIQYVLNQIEKVSSGTNISLGQGTLSGRRLLWVDDHPSNNLYEAGLFERAGMEVVSAISTEEAKRKLSLGRFDVVISDVYRNEEGSRKSDAGYELLQWLRRHGHQKPFIFYTGDAKRIDSKKSEGALGCADQPAVLIDLVMQAVRQDDIQKGRWGGRAIRNGRRLEASVTEVGPRNFRIELRVRDSEEKTTFPDDIELGLLEGYVEFHLHQTFPTPILKKPVLDGVARCWLHAYGAFTVGAVADGGQTQLELDLSLDESFPEEFRAN